MADLEEPKYKKKKGSSMSKSKVKSKHKHQYKQCLLLNSGRPHRAFYCTLCGKVKNIKFFEMEPIGNGLFRMLTTEEVLKRYSDLERFEISDLNATKYVPIDSTENDEGKRFV